MLRPLRQAPAFVPIVFAAGCLQMMQPAAYQPADPAAVKERQRQGLAQSLGYPTKKTEADFDRTVTEQTAKFKRSGRSGQMLLQSPEPFTFDGKEGTCYTVVMRLEGDAKWDIAGDYTKFDFQRPEITGSGGPGVVGPGAVASVGCAKTNGPITLTMASMVEGDRIGFGAAKLELYARVLTRAEKKAMEEDERRQIAEQQEFARQEREREERRRQEDARRREDEDRARREREASQSRSSGGSSSGGSSGPVSVTIRSACSRTAKVFYGSNPKFGSGTSSSISSNSVQSKSFRVGDMFWVTDESGNGLDSVTVSERTRGIEISGSCSQLHER
ncbi:MAG: hypothetical protein ACKV2T_39215 [Kofleriaceae bacterium]